MGCESVGYMVYRFGGVWDPEAPGSRSHSQGQERPLCPGLCRTPSPSRDGSPGRPGAAVRPCGRKLRSWQRLESQGLTEALGAWRPGQVSGWRALPGLAQSGVGVCARPRGVRARTRVST